jgi:transcriptional regulator with XRE-family HTH domain
VKKNSLGEHLRILRFTRNLTQQEVAEALNMKVRTLSRIENGVGNPRRETLQKLADFYGVTLED